MRRSTTCGPSSSITKLRKTATRSCPPPRALQLSVYASYVEGASSSFISRIDPGDLMVTTAAVGEEKLAELLAQKNVYRNLSPGRLVEESLRRGETRLAANGAVVGDTGARTGRSPKDKFTV